MNARNRVFAILALLTVGSLIWYFVTVRPKGDLQLIGTVDANEVLVSARIPGRIQTLTVKEGDTVKAGQLIAVIESDDLEAALKAAEATAASQSSNSPAQLRPSARTAAKPPAPPSTPRRRFALRRLRWPRRRPTRTSAGRYQPHRGAGPAGHHERAGPGRAVTSLQAAKAAVNARAKTSPPPRPRCARPAPMSC